MWMSHHKLKKTSSPLLTRDVIMLRAVRPVLMACIATTVLLSWSPYATGQLPKLLGQRVSAAVKSASTGLPATDADIDKEIDRIKERLHKIRTEAASAGAGATAGSDLAVGARPEEMRLRERMTSDLTITLEKQVDILDELKAIRKDNAADAAEQASWKGFSQKPPYPIAFLDAIRDALLVERLAFDSFTIRHSFANKARAQFDRDLKKSRKDLRLAQEERTKNTGKPQEKSSMWLLELARLRNELNETRLVLAELQRLVYATAIQGKRSYLAFLEEKLKTAEVSSPLSEEDLDKKLQELDSRRRDIEAELLKEQNVAAGAQVKLDHILEEMSHLPLTAPAAPPSQDSGKKWYQIFKSSPEQKGETASFEKLTTLKLNYDAEQVFLESTQFKITVLKGQLQMVSTAEKIWQDRFWLTKKPPLSEMRQKLVETRQTLENLKLVKKYAESTLSNWLNLVRNQKEKIAAANESHKERQTQQLILTAYEERQDITLRLIEGIGNIERLINRLNDELSQRIKKASIGSHVRERLQIVASFIQSIWNTELYVAEETTIVDDRSIVKPVSVTIGKAIKALFILLVGTWIARKIGRVIQWGLTKKLGQSSSRAEQIGKVIFIMMFIGVVVFSLVSVNIPLAVFAFLGGALAIGIGFGAQHLINNFIRGLILLFDRTIKVGDIVEVDGEGGRVTDVGMRNSRIQRFDGIELMVPNSQFLQQKVTNWTLTDRRIRYKVSVGVAYGSSTRKTADIIMKAVETHARVLTDPPPTIIFEEFGDSALIFTVYFWLELISNRDNRIALSDIRHAINELLDKAGIVIAFPQRDIHLDSAKPFEVKVVKPETDKNGE